MWKSRTITDSESEGLSWVGRSGTDEKDCHSFAAVDILFPCLGLCNPPLHSGMAFGGKKPNRMKLKVPSRYYLLRFLDLQFSVLGGLVDN